MRIVRLLTHLGLLLVLATTFLCICCEGAQDETENNKKEGHVPKLFDFESYVDKYRKKYMPIETLNKAKLFFGRTLEIFKHNMLYKTGKIDYYLAQNEFTDLTPNELEEKFSKNNFEDMQPVSEALINPDAPADSFLDADHDLQLIEEPLPGSKKQAEVGVNFLGDQSIDDPRRMLVEIKAEPDIANKIAAAANVKKPEVLSEEEKKIREAREKNHIQYRPMVKSNNKKYDPSMITSYGLFNDWGKKNKPENYAKFVLEGDFDFNLEPYPIVKAPEKLVLEENNPIKALGDLVNTAKNFYDFFSFDGSLVDYYEDDEEDEWEDDDETFHDAKDTFDKSSGSDGGGKKKSGQIRKSERDRVVKYEVDWRDTGCVSKAKAQQSCNCCYAFTALGLMEYFYCMQKKELTEFSAQYVVDCGTRVNLNGCRGGKISGVGNFIRKYGLELNTLYPYVGAEKECPYGQHEELTEKGGYLKPQIKAWQNFPSISAWAKWLKTSPIIVGINMPVDFLAYEGGIHNGLNCDQKMVHALLLVGSGVAADGKKFWLLKNSYSSDWGENGYFRLAKTAPVRCFNMATVVRVQFND